MSRRYWKVTLTIQNGQLAKGIREREAKLNTGSFGKKSAVPTHHFHEYVRSRGPLLSFSGQGHVCWPTGLQSSPLLLLRTASVAAVATEDEEEDEEERAAEDEYSANPFCVSR